MSPICIYCKRSDVPFNREHVIPEAFGRFDSNNLVLHNIVCHDCNNFFSRELEQFFNRGSYEAVQRFKHGLKKPSLGHELRAERVEFLVPEGELQGARLYMSSNEGRPCMRWHPQAGFKLARSSGRDFFLLRELERMKSLDRSKYVLKHERAILIVANSDDEERRILAEFQRLSITFDRKSHITPKDTTRKEMDVEITGIFDRVSARTISKIAFNYLAAIVGAERCLHPDFDAAREFIRNGTDPGYRVLTQSRRPILAADSVRWRQTDGHLVVLEAVKNWTQVLARVSLFNAFTYDIILCRQRSGPLLWPINSGHHFNVRDKTVSALAKWSQPAGLILTTPRFGG